MIEFLVNYWQFLSRNRKVYQANKASLFIQNCRGFKMRSCNVSLKVNNIKE